MLFVPGVSLPAEAAACHATPCAPAAVQGITVTDFGGGIDRANALGVDLDGRIVAAGESTIGGTTDFAIARYLPDGSLDPSFGTNGTILTNFGRSANGANAVAMLPGGRIVIAGYSGVQDGGFDFALARYRTDGQLDPTFGVGGQVLTDFVDTRGVDVAKAVAIQADGKLVVSGYSGTYGEDFDFVVARFRRNGGLDRSFGGDGHVLDPAFGTSGLLLIDVSGTGSLDSAKTVVLDGGWILAGGLPDAAGTSDFLLAVIQ